MTFVCMLRLREGWFKDHVDQGVHGTCACLREGKGGDNYRKFMTCIVFY